MVYNPNHSTFDEGFNPKTGVYHVYVDYRTERPAYKIVAAVAAVTGVEPRELTPLESCFDSESLNTLFDGDGGNSARTMAYVRFKYEGCTVTLYNSGELTIEPPESE